LATKIRLKRFGGRHDPHFRIVVADSRKQRDGRVIEELGFYSPAGSDIDFSVDAERASHWLSVGAQPTETVRSLLQKAGVIEGPAGEDVQEAAVEAAEAEEVAEEAAAETVDEDEAADDE